MSNRQTTRRSVLFTLVTATTGGLAGCSQSDDSSNTPTTMDESGDEAATTTPEDSGLPEGASYPEPDKPATEITLLETSNDYEVVIVEADRNEKYIGETLRFPKAGFIDDVEGYQYFSAYEDEDGRSPQEGIAVRKEDMEQSTSELRANDASTRYEIEGPLYAVESVGGGNVLVLGGGEVTVTML